MNSKRKAALKKHISNSYGIGEIDQKTSSRVKERRHSFGFESIFRETDSAQGNLSMQASPFGYSPTSPRPLYQQVKHCIEEQIRIGTWQPDTKIPSENELVETLNVSRMTIHRALRELTADGHLVRLQGVGTFVAPPKPQLALFEIKSIANEVKSRGRVHSCEVFLLQQEVASDDLGEAMSLPHNSLVYHSLIVHRDSGFAIQLEDRYVNPDVFPDFIKQDFTIMTPSEYLLKIAPVTKAEHIIEAVMPDEQIQKLLEMEATEPCLVLHRRTWANSMVATKSRLVYPGAHYKIGGHFKPPSLVH